MNLSISVAMNVVCALLHEQLVGSLVCSHPIEPHTLLSTKTNKCYDLFTANHDWLWRPGTSCASRHEIMRNCTHVIWQ